MTGDEKLEGATEGEYSVTITPGLGQDQTEAEQFGVVEVTEQYSVKPGEKNHFIIKVSRRQ